MSVAARDLLVPTVRLLGGHVAGRTQDVSCSRVDLAVEPFGQPEIGDLGLSLCVRQEHVCRLEVTVDDPHQVRRVDCPG